MKLPSWPAWYYGPKGASAVFETAEDVPTGWVEHPSLVDGSAPAKASQPAAAATTVVDGSGVAWDGAINTANRAQTASGLWQLLPGKSRPEAVKPPVLDL